MHLLIAQAYLLNNALLILLISLPNKGPQSVVLISKKSGEALLSINQLIWNPKWNASVKAQNNSLSWKAGLWFFKNLFIYLSVGRAGSSCCSTWALGASFVAQGALLLRGMWELPWPGINPILCIGRKILYHWTTREDLPFLKNGLFALILNCMSCSYILGINSILDMSFPNIFSHSVGCLFIFWQFLLLCKMFWVKLGPIFLVLLLYRLPEKKDLKNIVTIYVSVLPRVFF